MNPLRCWLLLFGLFLSLAQAPAADWPTYRGEVARRGVSSESLDPAKLEPSWAHRSPHWPRPAWPGPARWDAYNRINELRSMRNYDACYHVVSAGDSVYFGSSADDSLYCLEAASGKQRWVHTTGGPIRIAPTLAAGKVYFGSDDGTAYCLSAADGKLIWKFSSAPTPALVLHNQRPISYWPIRTGIVVTEGTAYFAASLFPWKKSFLCAVDASTGKSEGPGRFVKSFSDLTLEGSFLLSPRGLVAPQGRAEPLLFDRTTGNAIGKLQGSQGCFALLTEDDLVLQGPGNRHGEITITNPATRTKIAAFPRSNAAVVRGELAFLVDDNAVFGVNRQTGVRLWKKTRLHVHELLLAGETLYVGGRDEIVALSASTGEMLARLPVQGRVHGLALANGRLYASTDEGVIHCFMPTGKGGPLVKDLPPVVDPLRPISEVKDKALLGRWVFQTPQIVAKDLAPEVKTKVKIRGTVSDLLGHSAGKILGQVEVQRFGSVEALVMDAAHQGIQLEADFKKAKLPTKEFTATAWVRIDKAIPWGGILSAFQHNGPFQRGWLLGYKNDRLCVAVAAEEGKNVITYLTAPQPFEPGRWYHVAGSYDGALLQLFVDGQLVATSKAQQGPIRYPPKAFYYLATYKDDDEHFPLTGAIHEVRLYERVLSLDEIQQQHRELAEVFPAPVAANVAKTKTPPLRLAAGPMLRFTSPTTAVVNYWTTEQTPSLIEFGEGKDLQAVAGEKKPSTSHEVKLTGLRRDRLYHYRIQAKTEKETKATELFECDTHVNYTIPLLEPAKKKNLTFMEEIEAEQEAQMARQRGVMVFLGIQDSEMFLSVTRKCGMHIIGVDDDLSRIEKLRQQLLDSAEYGTRATLLHVPKLHAIPLPSGCANFIVVPKVAEKGKMPIDIAQFERLLHPATGAGRCYGPGVTSAKLNDWLKESKLRVMGVDGNFMLRPQARSGIGVWSHQFGLPDNAGFAGETLSGATSVDDLEIAWFGEPGPRYMGDRNPRKPAPLAVNGRLFIQGFGRAAAVDAHNGSLLWSLELPRFARFNILRDCGNWCADDIYVYLAIDDECWIIEAGPGMLDERLSLRTVLAEPQLEADWGYIARAGKLLLGSTVKRESAYKGYWGSEHWYDAKSGALNQIVCSDRLFAMSKDGGKAQWIYQGGAILNPTITIAGKMVYFVESKSPKLKLPASGRLGDELWANLQLVALDLESGREAWRKPINPLAGQAAFYLAHGQGKLVLVSSEKGRYGIYTFDPQDGKPLWDRTIKWDADHHGAHLSRPVILEKKLLLRPYVLDLTNGDKLTTTFPKGHGCGTYAATDRLVFYRAGDLCAWDLQSDRATRWPRLRADCLLSTIPACGMLLSPEGGGGCSCGGWLEMSAGFSPRTR